MHDAADRGGRDCRSDDDQNDLIETTIVPDKKGGSGTLPNLLIVLCGGFPPNFVSDLETAQLSDSTHFGGS